GAHPSSTSSRPERAVAVTPCTAAPPLSNVSPLERAGPPPLTTATAASEGGPRVFVSDALYFPCFAAHESRRPMVRLNTSAPGFESRSTQKYPTRSNCTRSPG